MGAVTSSLPLRASGCPADAARAARNECNLSFQFLGHCFSPIRALRNGGYWIVILIHTFLHARDRFGFDRDSGRQDWLQSDFGVSATSQL